MSAPYQKQSSTSKAAAKAVEPFARTARYRVWQFIRDNPRCTDQHVQHALTMNPNTQRPRRVELESAGLIRPHGQSKTPRGSEGVAWVVTDKSYPQDWSKVERRSDMRQRRSERPTAQEIRITVETMREAYKVMGDMAFPQEAVKVLRWLARQV